MSFRWEISLNKKFHFFYIENLLKGCIKIEGSIFTEICLEDEKEVYSNVGRTLEESKEYLLSKLGINMYIEIGREDGMICYEF